MSKKQKIWLAVFLAMFLIPEILWNNYILIIFYWIVNAMTGFTWSQIYNFHLFSNIKSGEVKAFIALIEVIGFALSYFVLILYKIPKNDFARNIIIVIGGLLLWMLSYILQGFWMSPQIG